MKKRKINKEKAFCTISICFILGCCIFYGTRFVKLYLENKKTEEVEVNSLARTLKKENFGEDNFKNINGSYYYYGNDIDNNYVLYSNILWRIIRVNSDNSITLISNDSLLHLAYGEVENYTDSYIYSYLNNSSEENTGILESLLNDKEKYLVNNKTCIDKLDKLETKCEKYLDTSYINLLSVSDYVNAGNTESFINNSNNFYLATMNSENKIWYLSNNNKLAINDGTSLYGVRPVITLNSEIDVINGNGTIDKPYTIEKKNGLFGSYVKLDNDIWRIYEYDEEHVKLVLNNYIKDNDTNIEYAYSKTKSTFNDTTSNTLAYYLNNTYLNSLSYKNLLQNCNYSNGYYGSENNFDYKEVLNSTIETKVAIQSVGSVILNSELNNYFLMTGTTKNGNLLYTINSGAMYGKTSTNKVNVVPTICINLDILTKGKGTIKKPYEVIE